MVEAATSEKLEVSFGEDDPSRDLVLSFLKNREQKPHSGCRVLFWCMGGILRLLWLMLDILIKKHHNSHRCIVSPLFLPLSVCKNTSLLPPLNCMEQIP